MGLRPYHNWSSKFIDPYMTKEERDAINKYIDSSAKKHPGYRHRDDPCHTIIGVVKKFGVRAIPVAFDHLDEDAQQTVAKTLDKKMTKLAKKMAKGLPGYGFLDK